MSFLESPQRVDQLGYPLVSFMFHSWYLNKLFVILTSFLAAILNSGAQIRRFVPSDAVESFSESSTWRPPRVLRLGVAVESRIILLFIELTDWCV